MFIFHVFMNRFWLCFNPCSKTRRINRVLSRTGAARVATEAKRVGSGWPGSDPTFLRVQRRTEETSAQNLYSKLFESNNIDPRSPKIEINWLIYAVNIKKNSKKNEGQSVFGEETWLGLQKDWRKRQWQ